MARITTTDDIRQLGRIMSVWAHPDDETYSCGGLMAAAVRNGQVVVCVTATKGEAGSQDEQRWPSATLGEVRAKELTAALNILGITKHYWGDYSDGGCAGAPLKQAAESLAALIRRHRPDTILTFGPDGMTGHPDHQAISKWVSAALKLIDGHTTAVYHVATTPELYEHLRPADEKLNIFFNIDQPPLVKPGECDICFELPETLWRIKYDAVAAQPSQTESMLSFLGKEAFTNYFKYETFVRAD